MASVTLPAAAPAFLAAAGWGEATVEEFSADAAFRRYFRLRRGKGGKESCVLMYAPDPSERSEWFVALARHIRAQGLSAPAIFDCRLEEGLILLEDLGERQYFALLPDAQDECELYAAATDVLAALHAAAMPRRLGDVTIEPYTDERMIEEAELLLDWYWPESLGAAADQTVREAFIGAWREALPAARYADDRLVQLDYHSPNLMWLPEREGIRRVGILDFQDAMRGPASYDVVSLLQDARRDVAEGLENFMIERYLAARAEFEREAFLASYAVMGAQRAVRILGVFVRLWRRDEKPGYMRHLPRLWAHLDANLAHEALAPVRNWFDSHMPASRRGDLGAAA